MMIPAKAKDTEFESKRGEVVAAGESDLEYDRISELYHGRIFTKETQRIAKDRIHWICDQIQSGTVLDVGCSQGIATIILAGRGYDVVGIDVRADAIEYAEHEKSRLPKEVQAHVQFRVGNIFQLEPDDVGTFDSIVIGEVIEHFSDPASLLQVLRKFLRPGGVCVCTTPFGIKPNHDHYSTFTARSFYDLFSRFFSVKHLSVEDGYIRAVGGLRATDDIEFKGNEEKLNGDPDSLSIGELLNITENGLLKSQEALFEQIRMKSQVVREQKLKLREREEGLRSSRSEVKDVKRSLSELEGRYLTMQAAMRDKSFHSKAIVKSRRKMFQRYEVEQLFKDSFAFHLGYLPIAILRYLQFREPVRPFLKVLLERPLRVLLRKALGNQFLQLRPEEFIRGVRKQLRTGSPASAYSWIQHVVQSGVISKSIAGEIGFILMRFSPQPKLFEFLEWGLLKGTPSKELLESICELWSEAALAEEKGLQSQIEERLAASSVNQSIRFNEIQERFPSLVQKGILFPKLHVKNQGKNGIIKLFYVASCEQPLARIEKAFRGESKERLLELLQTVCRICEFREAEQKELELKFYARWDFDRFLALVGEKSGNLEWDARLHKEISEQLFRRGMLREAQRYAAIFAMKSGDNRRLRMIEGQLSLLNEGFPPAKFQGRPSWAATPSTSLYFLHNSLPFCSGGYATRTHGLLSAANRAGLNVIGVSRLGFPVDRGTDPGAVIPELVIDEVRYLRLLEEGKGYGQIPLRDYLFAYSEAIERLTERERPAILHAASNFMNGAAANYVGRKFGIPTVYEVRGLWEVTRMSREPDWPKSDIFKMQVKMETEVCSNATRVITITGALKEELMRRGVLGEKISVLPNGVDANRFVKQVKDVELAEKLRIAPGIPVIGYVGSVVDYEGLDLLLRALRILLDEGVAAHLLIVGDGDAKAGLVALAKELALGEAITFTGRVPHHEVEAYYSLVDIAPFPRTPLPVCEMVSPIKPLEAMALEKAVVVSNVQALCEMVQDGVTGLQFKKGDLDDLVVKLKLLLQDEELRSSLGGRARQWIVRERDWGVLVERLRSVYQEISSEYFVAESADLTGQGISV